jgi:phosphoribosylglycinamide formyltransferase-1
LNTHERVLESSDNIHGITVHFVDESLDGGPICAQSSLEITTRSVKQLEQQIHKLEHELYPKVVSWFGEGLLRLTEGKVYFENRELKIGEINEK